MTLDTITSAQIDGHHHRITTKAPVVPGSPTVRLTFACGLTLDCLPDWAHTPPVHVDENGADVPWPITLAEDVPADCPGCA